MKFILAFLLAVPLFGQATLTLQVPGEANTSITFSAEMVAAAQNQIKTVGGQTLAQSATSLTQNVLAADTTINVGATTGVTAGMGAKIGNEVMLITATSSTTLSVVRARIGTTAAGYTSGTVVTYLASGSYGALVKNILVQWAQSNLITYPGPTISTAQAAIVTQQATINTALSGAVQ